MALAKKIEDSAKCLLTNLFLFPTADDINFAELEKNFGTVIVLPEDKISEIKFTTPELLTKILSMMILSLENNTLVGLDFDTVIEVMKNSGIMYVGIGEDFGESATKKSLEFPLMLCNTDNLSKVFIIFAANESEKISMLDVGNSIRFLEKFIDYNSNKIIIYQVIAEKNFNGMNVLVIAN